MNADQHKWFGDVKVGEKLAIDGGRIVLRVEAKSGQLARIRLEFTKPTSVSRVESSAASFAAQGVR